MSWWRTLRWRNRLLISWTKTTSWGTSWRTCCRGCRRATPCKTLHWSKRSPYFRTNSLHRTIQTRCLNRLDSRSAKTSLKPLILLLKSLLVLLGPCLEVTLQPSHQPWTLTPMIRKNTSRSWSSQFRGLRTSCKLPAKTSKLLRRKTPIWRTATRTIYSLTISWTRHSRRVRLE